MKHVAYILMIVVISILIYAFMIYTLANEQTEPINIKRLKNVQTEQTNEDYIGS